MRHLIQNLRFARPRKRWAFLVAVGAAFVVAVPVAWATFTDVPPSNSFYNDINAIQGAGVTTGCGGGNFCPTDNISRQAVAAFMHRAEPRVAQSTTVADSTISGSTASASDTVVGQVSIDVGGIGGGTQFVKVDAHMTTAWSAGSGKFPVTYYISDGGACTGTHSPVETVTVVHDTSTFLTASVSWAEPVPTGTTQTFVLCAATKLTNVAKVSGGFVLDATTYPFGSTGASTLDAGN